MGNSTNKKEKNENQKRVMERQRIKNGVEIISFKEPKKQCLLKRIFYNTKSFLTLIEPFLFISIILFVFWMIVYYHVYGKGLRKYDTMEYMVGSIESYYRETEGFKDILRNYEILDSKEGDDNTYINAYYNNRSDGTIFSFNEEKMEIITYKKSLDSITNFCELNKFEFLDLKFDKRENLIVYCTLGYKCNNVPHISHLELYFPTGEIIRSDNEFYKFLYEL